MRADKRQATEAPELSGLRRDGYQIMRQVLAPAAVESVQCFLADSVVNATRLLEPWGIARDDPDSGRKVASILAAARPGDLPDDVKSVMLGHFPLAIRLSSALWDIPRDPGLRAVLSAALESDALLMHMPPTARFVLPHNSGAGVPAHQDVSYNHHMAHFFTVWVPLVEIDENCGGMSVFEGSQSAPELLDDHKADQWLKPVDTTAFRERLCAPMSPGDIVIFNKWIIHRSQPNLSARLRLSVDFRFFPANVVSGKHALDLQSWRVLAPGEHAAAHA
jgi:hypothetical protein